MCIDFQIDMNPGTGQNVCGGWWCHNVTLVFCFGPNLFPLNLRFGIGPSRTIVAHYIVLVELLILETFL